MRSALGGKAFSLKENTQIYKKKKKQKSLYAETADNKLNSISVI